MLTVNEDNLSQPVAVKTLKGIIYVIVITLSSVYVYNTLYIVYRH